MIAHLRAALTLLGEALVVLVVLLSAGACAGVVKLGYCLIAGCR